MKILHDAGRLVARLSPAPVCDDCISQTLGLSGLERKIHPARELAGSDGFERRKDVCGLCGQTRLVTLRR